MQELESIDQICMNSNGDVKWPVLWEKLHKLMGDLKVLDTSNSLSSVTVGMIEFLRGDSIPNDFMSKWMEIRSSVFSLLVQTKT